MTLKEVAYATYVVGVNLNGHCPYCSKDMNNMPADYKVFHYKQEHTSNQPQPDTAGDS